MSGASTHIPLFIIYTITTALSKNDPSAYRIPAYPPSPRMILYCVCRTSHHVTPRCPLVLYRLCRISHHIRQRHYAAPCRIPLLLLRPSKKTTLVPYVCIDTYPTPFPIIFTWVCKGCKLLGRWNHLLMVIR